MPLCYVLHHSNGLSTFFMIIMISPSFLEHSVIVSIRSFSRSLNLSSVIISFVKICCLCNGIHTTFIRTTIKRIYFLSFKIPAQLQNLSYPLPSKVLSCLLPIRVPAVRDARNKLLSFDQLHFIFHFTNPYFHTMVVPSLSPLK